MNDKLLKPYNPQETEGRIYKTWEESGFFNPDTCVEKGVTKPEAEPFSIVMPPPNVTGVLHMGHGLMITIEDIMIRFNRMRGKKTLWLPGTDHAAIATQARVEKDIAKKEGKNRHDLGRQELLKRIEAFAKESHDTIVSQIKKLGASCDWSREAFTLDSARNKAVNTVFKKMYDEGIIYRGYRIVNWDPKGQTTISDDEIVYQEEKTKFYHLKYGPFVIATSRPETKFGDKYVVMHPDDKRYASYKEGQKISLEWINGPITATVIKDAAIDMNFGTGVMTITPWHDVTDFDIAERHKLDKEQVIDLHGRLLPIAGEFEGMKITEARAKIIEKLEKKGLITKIEDYTHNVATADRTGGVIEPQILNQWFVSVNKPIPSRDGKTLKELMREAVASGKVAIIPDYFTKTYFHWIDNLRDWCVSRQIWYGHRIPVWYKSDTNKRIHTNETNEEERYCGLEAPKGEGWIQDEDTLDTWFSSGLWTFSALGWPDEKTMARNHFVEFHPTSVLETGYEIIFFWVARMILMTEYVLGTIPFKKVYFNGTVRDGQGRKMSKSLGNGTDPIEVAEKFGTDAGRLALVVGTAPGTDSKIDENKIRGYKNFANKVWNIARFVLSNTEGITTGTTITEEVATDLHKITEENDLALINELKNLTKDITGDMENYRFHLASEKIYHYIWHRFADVILEESKKILSGTDSADSKANSKAKLSRQQTLLEILKTSLKILHPFAPFVTEEIWSMMPVAAVSAAVSDSTAVSASASAKISTKKLLMVETWPT
jgi:valyl-tRNA synthetase